MKTKWKKLTSIPLLCLALSMTMVLPAKASIWYAEITVICDVEVQVQDQGGYWRWVCVEGIKNECTPAFFSSCNYQPCDPISFPKR